MTKILLAFLLFCNSAYALDLREYFPVTTNTYLNAAGANNARYTFTQNGNFDSFYNAFFNMNKAGTVQVWKKEYWVNSAWCTKTHGVMFKGNDFIFAEVGDWTTIGGAGCAPSVTFGYKTSAGVNTGLIWQPVGGLQENGVYYNEMNTFAQASSGAAYVASGYQAYSKVGLIEVLPAFQAAYGRGADGVWCAGCGKVYADVVHMVMYHGTKTTSTVKIKCDSAPVNVKGAYYLQYKNYNGYAIELWLDKTKGIIQESTPFIEDGSYWNIPNCTFNNGGYTKYIDDVF
jgi:hypothetical protein